MGEFELIRRYFAAPSLQLRGPGVLLGIGDDCALLDPRTPIAVSTDLLVEGRHFYPDVEPRALGHKSLAVNLSDLAAMGAQPFAFTLALALPAERATDADFLDEFSCGLLELARRFGCPLVGGDTSAGPLAICITVLGRVDPAQALRRDAAASGDDVWVSGQLGDAALALHTLAATRSPGNPQGCVDTALRLRLERPEPRIALGLALRGVAHAAIDVSDGLIGDLGHVLEASAVGAEIDADAVPVSDALRACPPDLARRCALAGGDDYELCFTAPPDARDAIERIGRDTAIAVTRIGRIVPKRGLVVVAGGRPIEPVWRAFDHFAAR